jgi:hypothetical protein
MTYYDENSFTSTVSVFVTGKGGGFYNSFTGQHRIIFRNNHVNAITRSNINDYVGLIVCSTNDIFNLDNTLYTTINESLPICELSSRENQKSVYGVISNAEDDNELFASFHMLKVQVKKSSAENQHRIQVNSIGEGGIWVTNINGPLENGDYISSASIPGYGQKQTKNEDILCNFTVAKMACDCDFSLDKKVKQKVKVTYGPSGERFLDYDEYEFIQYEDDLDANGNQQLEYKFETRFLDANGSRLADEQEYQTRKANGEDVYIACFVGCTYHCG